MSINKVIFTGNLTRDPDESATGNGTPVLEFGVAINDRRKNPQTGEWESWPNFVECTIYGNRAEALGRFLRKGMYVTVEGKLRYSQWEKDGQKRSKLMVIADEIELPPRSQSAQIDSSPRSQSAQIDSSATVFDRRSTGGLYEDDAIPF